MARARCSREPPVIRATLPLPLRATVLCVHSRADENVPFRYSDRYVQAAVRAGGTAYLHEASSDHFTLIATHKTPEIASGAMFSVHENFYRQPRFPPSR